MRRFAFFVGTLAAAVMSVAGCEDGPNQPYSPAPAGAANTWNGNTGAGGLAADGGYVGTATQDYDASFGGTNANDLCTAPEEQKKWLANFSMPIAPPGLGGGIDMAGGVNGDGSAGYDSTKPFTYDPTKETWTGATVEQLEKLLCQGTASQYFIGITTQLSWGENGEFSVIYNANNRAIQDMIFTYGYAGTADATSADGNTKYSLSLNNVPITMTAKNGSPTQILFDWGNDVDFNAKVNAMYDAYRNTYAPTFPPDKDCVAAGHCIIGNNLSSGGYVWFTPLNFSFFVNTTVGTPQANSIPIILQLGLLKLLPFSNATSLLKLDQEGPSASAPNVGNTGKNCKYTLGMTFGDFDSTCVEPFPSGNVNNTVAKNKLFGGMSHTDEAYNFEISGVDPQFAATIANNTVVSDAQRPGPTDVAYDFGVDQSDIGFIANDYTNNDTTQAQDWHGIGMLTLEWANLVQQYMNAAGYSNTQLGDPACIANPANPGASKKCSGMEGIVTTAPPNLAPPSMAANALGWPGVYVDSTIAVGMKPGTWYSIFCTDGAGLDSTGNPSGYHNCMGGAHGGVATGGYYFDTAQTAVANAFSGNPPPELADRRFYFEQWILALVKYLQSASDPNATLATIDANPISQDNLFFDSAGGGFESGQYVFRNFVNTAKQPPTVLTVTTNLLTSVIDDFVFDRYNFRGEKALYTLLNTTPGDQPGYEPLLLTNIVGSPLLAAAYGSYDCATNTDPHNAACGYDATSGIPAITGPVDAFGTPIYTPYKDAFGQSVFHIAALNQPVTDTPLGVNAAPYTLLQSAMATVPVWNNPFDPSSGMSSTPAATALLPYFPSGASIGFPVTIDGSRDKFYNTNAIDFTGASVDANVDFEYLPVATGDGGTQNLTVVRAIETTEYMGMVFFCAEVDPNTGLPDVLGIRMYDSGQKLLDWIAKYPTATTDCNIQIKYSIYGNYPDYISSLNWGVRFGLNPGFGGSVVADGTVFDPNVVATLGQ